MRLIVVILLLNFSCKKYILEDVKPKEQKINIEIMAQRFRYFIDIGSGYQAVELYDNNAQISVKRREESYLLKEETLTGSFSFKGAIATSIYNYRTTSYYVPFKIEALYSGSWSTLHECNIDIRGNYADYTEILTINKFLPSQENHDKIIADYESKFNAVIFSPPLASNIITNTITSTNLEDYNLIPVLYNNWTTFKANHNVYGQFTGTGDPYGRWPYFKLRTIIDVGGGQYRYYFQTMIFYFAPGYNDTNGYQEVVWEGGSKAWIKLPTVDYQTETFAIDYAKKCYKFDDILDYIISSLDPSLSFDGTLAGYYDYDYMLIGNTNEFSIKSFDSINISLKQLFDLMKYYYGIEWYIDSGYIKFRNIPYEYYNTTYDWDTEANNLDLSPAYNPLPDKEIFNFKDTSQYPFTRSYFAKGVLTDNNVFDYTNEFYHDVLSLKEVANEENQLFFALTSDGSAIIVRDMKFFNDTNSSSVYAEHDIYYVRADPNLDYGLFPIAFFGDRPLWKYTHKKNLQDWVSFDLLSRIKLAGEYGILNSYIIDLKTGVGEFELFLT